MRGHTATVTDYNTFYTISQELFLSAECKTQNAKFQGANMRHRKTSETWRSFKMPTAGPDILHFALCILHLNFHLTILTISL